MSTATAVRVLVSAMTGSPLASSLLINTVLGCIDICELMKDKLQD